MLIVQKAAQSAGAGSDECAAPRVGAERAQRGAGCGAEHCGAAGAAGGGGAAGRNAEDDAYLPGDGLEAGPMDQLIGHSITYRIAVGPRAGRKVFTLQTLPDSGEAFDDPVGRVSGLSLHAGVAAKAHQRQKLERLCRYISRPAVSEKCLSLTPNGNIRYQLKTPYRDGTTHVMFEPLDFIARLAALVSKPQVNLTPYHGVFAPNSRDRAAVTPAKRGKGANPAGLEEEQEKTPAQRRAAMTWPQRLKREPSRFRSTVRIWDDPVGRRAKPEISGGRKSGVKSADPKSRLWRKPNRPPPGRLCP